MVELSRLNIVTGGDGPYKMNPIFKENLKNALVGGLVFFHFIIHFVFSLFFCCPIDYRSNFLIKPKNDILFNHFFIGLLYFSFSMFIIFIKWERI